MKTVIAIAVCMLLSACASSGSKPEDILNALAKNYAHCERTVTYAAAVGPLNPGSGATVSGTVHCPPLVTPGDDIPIE